MEKTYTIPAENLPAVEKRFAKLAKAAARCEVPAPTMSVGPGIEKIGFNGKNGWTPASEEQLTGEYARMNADRPRVVKTFHEVRVTGEAPIIAGWKFLATLQKTEEGTLIFNVPGEEMNAIYRSPDYDASKCDYCMMNRNRKETFVVRRIDGTDERAVGRNCLQDFLGHKDPHAIANYAEDLGAFDSFMGGASDGQAGGEEAVDLMSFLTVAAAFVRTDGYYRSSKMVYEERAQTSTGKDAWYYATEPQSRDTHYLKINKEIDPITATDTASWVEMNLQPLSWEEKDDYSHNLCVAFNRGYVTFKTAGIVASAVSAYRRAVKTPAKASETVNPGKHLGTVGDKIEIDVKVVSMVPFTSDWGNSNVITFEDLEGNTLKTFSNSKTTEFKVGEYVRIKGKVKKHDSWKGASQTVLNYVKVA